MLNLLRNLIPGDETAIAIQNDYDTAVVFRELDGSYVLETQDWDSHANTADQMYSTLARESFRHVGFDKAPIARFR